MKRLLLISVLLVGCATVPLEEGSLAYMRNERAIEIQKECNDYFFKREMAGVKTVYILGYSTTQRYCTAVAQKYRKTGYEVQYRVKNSGARRAR